MLLAGTLDGCFSVPETTLHPETDGTPERTLDRPVHRLHSTPDGALAATTDGLYRTTDGREWTRLVGGDLRSVSVGGARYAGTADGRVLHLDGDDWTDRGPVAVPGDRSRTPEGPPSVRTLAATGDALWAGLEVGGVHVSRDGGRTWDSRAAGVHDDVHHLLPVERGDVAGDAGALIGSVVAACGNGCYWTTDGGRSWRRLDAGFEDFWYNYHRESLAHDGRLHLGANAWGPEAPGGRLLELPLDPVTDAAADRPLDGRDARAVSSPTADEAFPLSWAVVDDTVIAGTMRVVDGFEQHSPAPVLRRADGADDGPGYEPVLTVPAAPRTLAVV